MSKNTGKRDMLAPAEIAAFCTQLSMILKSGITITEGIEIMSEDIKNEAGRTILLDLHSHLELGTPLHSGLIEVGVFPDYMVNMTEIGEATGKLDNVMDSLVLYYEREEAVSRMVRNAVTYPLVMIGMMLAVIIILIVRVMPIFNDVFAGLGAQMTGFSLAVLNLGQALSRYSITIVAILAVTAVLFLIFQSTQKGKEKLEYIKAASPLTKGLYTKIAAGRFASAMALMLSSGMDVDQSLEMVYKLIKTPMVREKIEKCQKFMLEGESFSQALLKVGMFSGLYAGMVGVAFRTGAVDTVMEKLAARYEEETASKINNIISALEPSLVAVLSIIVGMILLSVMLPLMSIMAYI